MKKIFAIGTFLLCCSLLYSAGFVFADKGKTEYVIVLPDKTAGFEEMAANDLHTLTSPKLQNFVKFRHLLEVDPLRATPIVLEIQGNMTIFRIGTHSR